MGHWIAVHLSMGASDMKKFLVNILIFFGIVAAVDFAAGKVFWYLQTKAGGRTGAEYYACKKSNEDVIIMGSSRASHHYVPQIITDSLGLSCFNAGQDGNGIILQYGRWKMLSERYSPRMIIYDINPSFDFLENDNMAYVDRLKPFAGDRKVRDYIGEIFPMEQLKLMSQMYRYNYKFIEMVSDYGKGIGNSGYLPLYGQIRQEVVDGYESKVSSIEYDEAKLKYLECLARECKEKGVKLVLAVSPYYGGGSYDLNTFASVKEMANKNGADFLYYNTDEYDFNPDYFKDSYHLNDNGAVKFSSDLAGKLKEII